MANAANVKWEGCGWTKEETKRKEQGYQLFFLPSLLSFERNGQVKRRRQLSSLPSQTACDRLLRSPVSSFTIFYDRRGKTKRPGYRSQDVNSVKFFGGIFGFFSFWLNLFNFFFFGIVALQTTNEETKRKRNKENQSLTFFFYFLDGGHKGNTLHNIYIHIGQ